MMLDYKLRDHDHGHDHGHDHCDCGHDHDHDHCDCGHDHDHCDCSHDHDHHHHGHCDCGCEHDHEHENVPTRELEGEPTFSFHVLDVDCPNCALGVQNAVRNLECVEDARLVYATATLDVICDPTTNVTECKRQVLQTVRSCGEDLELTDEERVELEAERPWFVENREKILMSISAFALVAGLVTEHLLHNDQRAIPFYVVASLAGLVYIAPMAIASLRRRTADMNVLMCIAVIGALIIGFTGDPEVFGDAAIVIFLNQVGEWLEGWSMRRTSGSVRQLMELAPNVSHVVTPEGTTTDVQTSGVGEGYTIRVLPGERVPLDGIIVQGASSFNEAPVTGESVPQDKGVGAEVFAGSLNSNAVVDIKVTADEDETTLSRIVSQVQGAQAEKAPYESFVDRFAAIYTPLVVAGAIVLGIVVPLIISIAHGSFDADVWHHWVYRACSLLVVACPCALVISTPVSFVSALNCAARSGVLVKGGAYFDIATRVTNIAFDKTGTLTTGAPAVTEVVALGGVSDGEVLSIAATLEASSTHPLAHAVVDMAEELGIELRAAEQVEEIAANGVRGIVGGRTCSIGKLGFAREEGSVADEVAQAVERLGETGASALVVMCDGVSVGVIGVADTLHESAPEALGKLKTAGKGLALEMLTGDNAHAAAAVARQAGITNVSAELLPSQKLDRIGEIQESGGVVAMVGDGINDAPALAKADLGVTMGAAASDTALEVADVALMSDGLKQLPSFFHLAKRTMNVVRENIAFAIFVKMLVFVLVIAGVAGMGAAVFADTGVALIVIVNGMRLMHVSKLSW
ncbi:MAG: cation-translocating P-type ATPase [Atopobiaceae bacterium]|nr:cation-translocating P-type ATPase [Atopobiaceae bacterium]